MITDSRLYDHQDRTAVQFLRLRAKQLRREAAVLTQKANELEEGLLGRHILGGQELVNIVVGILKRHQAFGPYHRGYHYRALLSEVQRTTGRSVRGADPAATLLANMQRDSRLENVEPGSGRYRLKGAS